ncbi:MAG: LacI family DNA-binding transcriptional regulator [Oceanospirillaceae bacterium]|nr:LacI family DNA-binding transcriptional regulator [Oceanospirillaceae bacterium]
MATLQDIADRLGISRATVSRALNDFPEVGAKTKAKVRSVAQELGYTPNLTARKLISGKSGMIALVAQGEDWNTVFDLSPGSFLGTLNQAFDDHDLDLVMRLATDRDKTNLYARLAQRSFVDCIVINSPMVEDERISALLKTGAKFVVHGRDAQHEKYAYYDIDNYGAFKQATSYLLDLGHKNIAVFVHNEDHAYARRRLEGIRDAVSSRSAESSIAVYKDDASTHFSYTIAKEALSAKTPASAVICVDGVSQALGVYRAARERGLEIGRDVSVIAHDDVLKRWDATKFAPSLTVVRRPVVDACAYLVRAVEGIIEGKPVEELQFIDTAEFIVRGSTGVYVDSGVQSTAINPA